MQAHFVLPRAPVPDRDGTLSTGFQIVPQTSLIGPWLPAIGQSNFHSCPFASQLQPLCMIDASLYWLDWNKEYPQHDQIGDRNDRGDHLYPISMAPFARQLSGACKSDDGNTDNFLNGEIEPGAVNCRERASHIRPDKPDSCFNVG